MFTISLEAVPLNMSGIKALDEARRLGLPDTSSLWFVTNGRQKGENSPTIEVGESFARAWFSEGATISTVKVPLNLLVAGDVRMATEGNTYAVTFADLSAERARELYVAVRFKACRDQVKRLEDEIKILIEQSCRDHLG